MSPSPQATEPSEREDTKTHDRTIEDFGAEDFRHFVDEFEHKEDEQRHKLQREATDDRRHRVDELIHQHITGDTWRSTLRNARSAAESGQKDFLLLRFPSDLCSDGGRAINVFEGDWPATLRGEPAEIYQHWEQELKPRGFHLVARVLDFPGGMPGDIGLFLTWREAVAG